jgi:uncharacterized SAM-binding protein YcdF (DUF218 family)
VERRFFPLLGILIFGLGLLLAIILTSGLWLPGVGRMLVEDDGPAKADIGVVLGGDYWGDRIIRAGELIREGYIPQALVSGPPGFYGYHECDLAIPFIVSKGYARSGFIPFPHNGLNTRDEARAVLAELRRRNIHSYLLITSDYHSRRAARTFRNVERAMNYNPTLRVVDSPDRLFAMNHWWQSREGQKAVFLEWSKTVAYTLGR